MHMKVILALKDCGDLSSPGRIWESQAEQGSDVSVADRREELMVPVLVHEVPH